MPPASMSYTVVGFSAELDWRPLHFVEPIPPYSVCNACGLLRKRTALLPCRHTLCEACYELSAPDSSRVCPLDGQQCEDENIFIKEFPSDELLKREVKCWNEGSGCREVLPASKIAQHFQLECRHHTVSCLRCTATVLCTEVCAHLLSKCSSTAVPAVSECSATATPSYSDYQGDSSCKEMMSLTQLADKQANDEKTLHEKHLLCRVTNGDRLDEVVEKVNNCQETLREELRQGINSLKDAVSREAMEVRSELRDCVKKCLDEIAEFREETKGRMIAASDTLNIAANSAYKIEKLLKDELAEVSREKWDSGCEGGTERIEESTPAKGRIDTALVKPHNLQASLCEFIVKGVEPLVELARKTGNASCDCERVFLRGYCIQPSVDLFNYSGSIRLHAHFYLHKGDLDDVLHRPFEHKIKLSVVHPKGKAEREIQERPSHLLLCNDNPQEGQALYAYWSDGFLSLQDLIREGYVEDDQLKVKFELLA